MVAERIRFHLDEHVDPDVAVALRRHGADATTTIEARLRTADDSAQLDFARAEQRVIVTDDSDFLRLAASGEEHPGIVVAHRQQHSIGEIVRGLILIYEVLSPEEMRNRIEYL
jgi:predicted nuclease of predicted toxin-antitoxin system